MSNYSANHAQEDPNTPWYKIIEMIQPGTRVLDIGCSSGNLGAELIEKKNCEVIGLDLSKQDVKLANKKLTRAMVLNAERDDLSELGKFDYIIFADVIEHLMDPIHTLRKIKSSLKKGGSVIFSIPNMAHMATRLMVLDGHIQYGETGLLDKTHLHYYDKVEVERIFKDAGYDIQQFDWVERYIPEVQIVKQLKDMGLDAGPSFLDRAKQVEATAYEFVGRSTPAQNISSHTSQLPFASPYVHELDERIDQLIDAHTKQLHDQELSYAKKLRQVESELHGVFGSISWRITLPLRLVNGLAIRTLARLRLLIYGIRKNPRLRPLERTELATAQRSYQEIDASLAKHRRTNKVMLAVIIHIFYPDLWPVIAAKLKSLEGIASFDLFVTLAGEGVDTEESIRKEYPDAFITVVPNRGRDVLPFVAIASKLKDKGYESVLKIHSKKSLHRNDGSDWFADILSNLLPASKPILKSLVKQMEDSNTGVIGPEKQYVSLEVNYTANAFFVMKLLKRLYPRQKCIEVNNAKEKYGFFAGTMFWIRLDTINPLLSTIAVTDFEKEAGQIDTTIAHSIERLLCLIPELENKHMYEVGPSGVKKTPYATDNIPEWSDLHIELENKIN